MAFFKEPYSYLFKKEGKNLTVVHTTVDQEVPKPGLPVYFSTHQVN